MSVKEAGNTIPIYSWQLSDDMQHVLIKGSYKKVCSLPKFVNACLVHGKPQQWRHSSFGNYYVHNIAEKKTRPIIPPSDPPRTAYATWSPTGSGIAFVTDNDLYVLPSAQCARSF